MKLKLCLAVLFVSCLVSFRPALAREWTDSSGTHKIEAELVKLDGEVVHLKKANGTIVQVPLNKLCWDDRKFVREQMAAKADAGPKTDPDHVVPEADSSHVVEKADPAHVVPEADSDANSGTSQSSPAQDPPAKPANDPALQKQQQDKLLAAKQKKLEQLQKEQERLQNAPAPRGQSSAQQKKVRAKRLEELQGQIAKLQEEIEAADAKTPGGESGHAGNETAANTPLLHLNRYTPATTAREMEDYPLTIRLMDDKILKIFSVPDRERAMEARRLLRVGIRANIPDKLLPLFVLKGIDIGKSKRVNAFTSAQIVRESLEFVAACGFQGPPPEVIDADHPRLGGNWDALREADETLRFNIVPSETFHHLAATVRIGTEIGFKGSTEAAEVLKAMKEGRPYYRFQGRERRIDLGYDSRWSGSGWSTVMAVGSGLSPGMPMSSEWLGDWSSNTAAARNWPLIALARALQWDIDVGPHVRSEVASKTSFLRLRLSNRELDELADVFVGLTRDADRLESRDEAALLGSLNVAMKKTIAAKRLRLAEKDIRAFTSTALGAAEAFANKVRYDSLASMVALHNPKYLLAVTSTFDSDNEQGSEHDKAIADYTEAIRLAPKDAEAYYNRGTSYVNRGEYDEAIADLTEAIRFNPKNTDAFCNRGLAYSHKGEHDKAIADYTEAIRLVPSNAIAYTNRGADYGIKGEYDKAIADSTEAIRLDPKRAKAFHVRGFAYRDRGEHDNAIADFTEAIGLNPNDAVAYFNRGKAYETKGEKAKAEADYTEAKRLGYRGE